MVLDNHKRTHFYNITLRVNEKNNIEPIHHLYYVCSIALYKVNFYDEM